MREVESNLTAKYGKPEDASDANVQDRKWKTATDEIELVFVPDVGGNGAVSFMSRSAGAN
jgi:hypothetical protein